MVDNIYKQIKTSSEDAILAIIGANHVEGMTQLLSDRYGFEQQPLEELGSNTM